MGRISLWMAVDLSFDCQYKSDYGAYGMDCGRTDDLGMLL